MRQNYSLPELQRILDQFPDAGTIGSAHLFTSGFENSSYHVVTEIGEYVIKVFEATGLSFETIFFEIQIMDLLFRSGSKTPKIFRTRNQELHANFGHKYAILMQFIKGENLDEHTISDHLAQQIGSETGKMDAALQFIKDESKTRQNYELDLKYFLTLEPKMNSLGIEFDPKILSEIFDRFRKIKPAFEALPSGLIQNDIALHNILAHGDELMGIIDFSDMVFSPYIQNIAVVFSQCFFTYNWQPHQGKLFLDAYQKFHPIDTPELEILYPLILARFVTLIVEFNHWNMIFGEDIQRTKFIHDNYDFLQRFLLIDEIEFVNLIR